jgi:hypothetical protein
MVIAALADSFDNEYGQSLRWSSLGSKGTVSEGQQPVLGLSIDYSEVHLGVSSLQTAHQKSRLVSMTTICTEETCYRS